MARFPPGLAAVCLAASAGLSLPADAQALGGKLVRLGATIAAVSGDAMTVRTAAGENLPVTLSPGVQIGAAIPRALSDIRPGAYVGSAVVRGGDGKLHAVELYILSDGPNGPGAARRPRGLPDQLMIDTTVDGVADGWRSHTLRLRVTNNVLDIEVDPDARVFGLVPGDRSLLLPGTPITMRAVRGPGGMLTAVAVQAERDGAKPHP